jgi:hypothetical protein
MRNDYMRVRALQRRFERLLEQVGSGTYPADWYDRKVAEMKADAERFDVEWAAVAGRRG